MTEWSEMLNRQDENKKRLSVTLTPETYYMLKTEFEDLKKLCPGLTCKWSMSRFVDAILYTELIKKRQK